MVKHATVWYGVAWYGMMWCKVRMAETKLTSFPALLGRPTMHSESSSTYEVYKVRCMYAADIEGVNERGNTILSLNVSLQYKIGRAH